LTVAHVCSRQKQLQNGAFAGLSTDLPSLR
jgi:hypothetical protein